MMSRLRIRTANTVVRTVVRNVVPVSREYEAYLSLPNDYTYLEVSEHFGISKVMVSYYLALLTRWSQDFLAWLESAR
jgi:hypothetical protein